VVALLYSRLPVLPPIDAPGLQGTSSSAPADVSADASPTAPEAPTAPADTGTKSEMAPSTPMDVLSNGSATLKGTCVFDFDKGIPDPAGDLWWQQKDDVVRFLAPRNGAMIANLGVGSFEAVTGERLVGEKYSTTPINGSNDANNALLPGTVVAIKTKGCHYAKMCINSYGYDLEMTWVTYQ
jgi:hypothetical protein